MKEYIKRPKATMAYSVGETVYTEIAINTFGKERVQYSNWIDEHCTGRFILYSKRIFFELKQDAILFKLKFG